METLEPVKKRSAKKKRRPNGFNLNEPPKQKRLKGIPAVYEPKAERGPASKCPKCGSYAFHNGVCFNYLNMLLKTPTDCNVKTEICGE